VTLVLDEETARWARIEAARRDISLSKFLAELLRERMRRAFGYEEAMRRSLSRRPRRLRRPGQRLPTRDEVHDRPGLR
jgi:hypothetical protein